MKTPEPLAMRMIIPNTGSPITFAGGEDEAGQVKLQFYGTGAEIQRLLELRGKELHVVLVEADN